jgi:hypothetical protein
MEMERKIKVLVAKRDLMVMIGEQRCCSCIEGCRHGSYIYRIASDS